MKDARVLIAEEEPLARRVLREHLRGIEWIKEIDEWADGLGAMRALDALQPDLLFMDIGMPVASGIEVSDQTSHRLHIIFTTANDRYGVPAFEVGALDYLPKPFERERVQRVISRARAAMEYSVPAIASRVWNALAETKRRRMKLVS